MAPLFECQGVELREAGGESFSTVVKGGHLVIDGSGGGQPVIKIDGTVVDFLPAVQNTFKKVDQRTFMLATNDLMSFNYITLPAGLPEADYAYVEQLLTAMKEGKPAPTRQEAAKAAAAVAPAAAAGAAAGAAAAGGAAASGGGNELFDFLKAVGAKAMHDTQMVAKAIQEKAAHDIQTMQDQQKAKQAEPATHPAT